VLDVGNIQLEVGASGQIGATVFQAQNVVVANESGIGCVMYATATVPPLNISLAILHAQVRRFIIRLSLGDSNKRCTLQFFRPSISLSRVSHLIETEVDL